MSCLVPGSPHSCSPTGPCPHQQAPPHPPRSPPPFVMPRIQSPPQYLEDMGRDVSWEVPHLAPPDCRKWDPLHAPKRHQILGDRREGLGFTSSLGPSHYPALPPGHALLPSPRTPVTQDSFAVLPLRLLSLLVLRLEPGKLGLSGIGEGGLCGPPGGSARPLPLGKLSCHT